MGTLFPIENKHALYQIIVCCFKIQNNIQRIQTIYEL